MSAHADKMLTDEIVPRLRLPNDIRWNGLGTTDARGGRQKACGVASGSHSTEFHWDALTKSEYAKIAKARLQPVLLPGVMPGSAKLEVLLARWRGLILDCGKF